MSDNKPAAPRQNDKTDVFDVRAYKPDGGEKAAVAVDGKAAQAPGERTLKKRLARLCASQPALILAVLVSVSALLTAFRGYLLPVTVFLTVLRTGYAVGLWLLHSSAGKRGAKLLAALSLYGTLAGILGLLALAVYIACAMFGRSLFFTAGSAVSLARTIYAAGLWAVLPALMCIMAAYCLYLFKRHERQLLCNLRDGLRYGFPFEQGSAAFTRNCTLSALVLLALQIVRAFFTSFSLLGISSASTVKMLDKLLLSQTSYAANLIGVLVHVAALVMAAALARTYGETVKKYKAQRSAKKSGT